MPPVPAKNVNYHFWEYLPPGYDENKVGGYPLMIFLHGRGESASNGHEGEVAQMEKVNNIGPPAHVKAGTDLCFKVNGSTECFIMLAPQIPWEKDSFETVPGYLVNYALENYNVDVNRIYVTGLSLGGIGAIAYAQHTSWGKEPGTAGVNVAKLAAIAVAPGGLPDEKNTCLFKTRDIAMWATHKINDATSWTRFPPMNKLVTDINQCGDTRAWMTPLDNYTGEDNHDAWTRFYNPTHQYYWPNVYEWFLLNPKTNNTRAPLVPVDAGPDKVINLPTSSVTLNGSGAGVTFQWTKRSGPDSYTFQNANAPVTTVSNLVFGVYTFRLTVTDNTSQSRFNDVIITVNPVPVSGKRSWHSWNMSTHSSLSTQGKIVSDIDNVTAKMEFYVSTNSTTVATGTQFQKYHNFIHPVAGVSVKNYWAENSGPAGDGAVYTYVGRSSVARGEEEGEANVGAPSGAFDVHMHPPVDSRQTVAAFIAPYAGNYIITHPGIRRVSNRGNTVEMRIYDNQQQLKYTLPSLSANQAWVREGVTVSIGQMSAGQRIYFTVVNKDGWDYDMCEIAFSVKADIPTTAARVQTEEVIVSDSPEKADAEETDYFIEVFDSNGYPVKEFSYTASPAQMRIVDLRSHVNRPGLYVFRIRNRGNKYETRKIFFMQ